MSVTLNDVDIVALSTTVHSTVGQGPPAYPVSWDEIFGRVERALNSHWRFTGRVSRGDKCVRVATELALDIVPAIYRHDPDTDPIEVYSFRESSRRDNFPRDHWQNGVTKNNALHTDGAFKPTVRLFKRGLCRPVRNRLLMSGFAACRRDARYRQIRPVRRRSFAIRLHRGTTTPPPAGSHLVPGSGDAAPRPRRHNGPRPTATRMRLGCRRACRP
jgi:hypothetical protein